MLCTAPSMILNSPSSSEQGQLASISLALPCTCHSPSVTAPTGQFPKVSSELHCHFCICLSGQTFPEKHGALVLGIIPHCLWFTSSASCNMHKSTHTQGLTLIFHPMHS